VRRFPTPPRAGRQMQVTGSIFAACSCAPGREGARIATRHKRRRRIVIGVMAPTHLLKRREMRHGAWRPDPDARALVTTTPHRTAKAR